MPGKRIEDMELSELLNEMAGAPSPGGATGNRVWTAIQVRLAEQQDNSARDLVKSTQGLVTATSRLVYATWGLVGATLVLVIAEVILKLLGRA